MINFCDSHSAERNIYFMVNCDSSESRSSLGEFHFKNKSRLRNEQITYWISKRNEFVAQIHSANLL
jgi:hypothetical protein